MSSPRGPAYTAALEYATIIHAAQVRKGTDTPYIKHPIAVAELLVADGGTETGRSPPCSTTRWRTRVDVGGWTTSSVGSAPASRR